MHKSRWTCINGCKIIALNVGLNAKTLRFYCLYCGGKVCCEITALEKDTRGPNFLNRLLGLTLLEGKS